MITKDQIDLIATCTDNVIGFIKNPAVMEYKREINNKTLLQIVTSACVITVDTGITPESSEDTKLPVYKLGAPSTWKKSSKGLILPTLTNEVTDSLADAVYKVGDTEATEFDKVMNTLAFLPVSSLKGSFDIYPEYAIADSKNSAYWVYTDRPDKDSFKIVGYEHTRNAVEESCFFVRLSKDTTNFIDVISKYNNVIDGVCIIKLCSYTALRFVSKSLKMTITLVGASQGAPTTINIDNKNFILNSDLTFSKGDSNMNIELKTELPTLDPIDFGNKTEETHNKSAVTDRKIVLDDKNNVTQQPLTNTVPKPVVADNPQVIQQESSSVFESNDNNNVTEDFDSISDTILETLEILKTNKKEELDKLKNISTAVKRLKRMHKSEVKDAASNVKQIEEFEKMKNTIKKIQGCLDI